MVLRARSRVRALAREVGGRVGRRQIAGHEARKAALLENGAA